MTIPGIYSQRDPHWAGLELGYNDDPYYNMFHFGCLVTAVANMLWWNGNATADPGAVDEWLKQNGGFESGGGNLIWSALQPLLDQVNMSARGYTTDIDSLNAFLADENAFALVWITKPGFPMHFSAMPFQNMIADSWDAVLKPLSTYTFHGAHMYSKNLPVPMAPTPSPPAVEPTPVAAPTVVAPIPEPIPTPVFSVETPIADPNTPPAPVVLPIDSVQAPANGQPSGPVEVTVTPPFVNVLADPPPLSEFEQTFHAFPEAKEIHLREDTMAFDAAGMNAPKAIFAGRPMLSSGTFIDNGRKYYRGTSGGWYGVPADDVIEEESQPAPSAPSEPSVWSRLAEIVRDPVGALIRFITRLHS